MSNSYENQLDDWVKKEKAGVDLLNSVGTLMYDKGIELILFRNQLLPYTFWFYIKMSYIVFMKIF